MHRIEKTGADSWEGQVYNAKDGQTYWVHLQVQPILEDGTPVDMASEKQRLKDQVADMDRRIARLEAAGEA